jgi:hypothetical protein
MINRGLLLLCVCAAFIRGADAQPRGSGKDFFEHDYARGIQHGVRVSAEKQKTPQPAAKPEGTQALSAGGVGQSPDQVAAISAQNAKSPEKSKGKPQLGDIPRVELFVNSADANHLNQVVARGVTFHKKGRIYLFSISHIGDYRTLSAENRAELEQLKIRYTAAPSVIYGEHITQSPTWAFVSEEGSRLVEGCLDPERYIDTNGAEPPTTKLDAMNKEEGNLASW